MRRFPDHRSMDGCELQLFSFPERDVVVPTLRDARQRTSEPSLSHCGPGVNFRPTEPLGSSLPHWATVKGVPNYRNAAVRGFMLSVAFSTHAYPNVLCSSGLVAPYSPIQPHGEFPTNAKNRPSAPSPARSETKGRSIAWSGLAVISASSLARPSRLPSHAARFRVRLPFAIGPRASLPRRERRRCAPASPPVSGPASALRLFVCVGCMIDESSKRMGAARFGHRTPGTVPGLPHPPSSRAPRGGAYGQKHRHGSHREGALLGATAA